MDGGRVQIIERGVLTAPDEAWDGRIMPGGTLGPALQPAPYRQ